MAKYQKLILEKGQGLIEVLISVGIIVLILAGIVPMMLTAMASKTKTFERKKAIELAEIKMEDVVNEEKNNGANFWPDEGEDFPDAGVQSADTEGFAGYSYQIIYTPNGATSPCVVEENNCVDVNVEVTWIKDPTKKVSFSRFFARN